MKIFKVMEKISESAGWEWTTCEETYWDSYEKARAEYENLVYSHGGTPTIEADEWRYSSCDNNFHRIISLAEIEIK